MLKEHEKDDIRAWLYVAMVFAAIYLLGPIGPATPRDPDACFNPVQTCN